MIAKEIIDDIKATANVEDVLSDFLSMKKRGANYLALCPFHQEKTPSFTISPGKNIYKCFGCGKSGDSVQFLMDHEHYTYPEALKFLGNKYGIEIPEEEVTEEQKQALDERESIYAVLSFAENFYKEQLNDQDYGKPIGLSYLNERQIDAEHIEKFGLGMSPKGWDTFTQHALKHAFKEEFLVEAGLSIKRDNGNLIDRFRERVMFPIYSISGRVLGFGGRILSPKSKKEAKYINSPDTLVYNKSEVLYGLHQSKKAIKTQDLCYLVEGYTDVIALHQKGVENVVASSGTSLTTGQIKLIHRYTKNICFLFDGDAAGIKASLRAIDLALEEGLNVFALELPQGEDPDSFSKNHDRQEVHDYLETEKKDFILFKTALLLPGTGRDPLKKTEAIADIVRSIAIIPEQLKRTIYVQECANLLGIDEESLISELNKQLANYLRQKRKSEPQEVDPIPEVVLKPKQQGTQTPLRLNKDYAKWQEKFMVEFLLKFGDLEIVHESEEGVITKTTVAQEIFEFIDEFDAEPEDELLNVICQEYREQFEQKQQGGFQNFLQHSNEEIKSLAIDLLEEKFEASEHWIRKIGMDVKKEDEYEITLKKVINRYKFSRVQALIQEMMERIKNAEDEAQEAKRLKAYRKLLKMRSTVANELGITVL
ncbi:MAG: DNA primase [Bacteroidetes bacterium]|nr:DNA primase [Bacteroidota bacterium]